MATLRLVFFVAFLVAVALATPVRKSTIQKRSFVVPRGVKVAPHKRNGLTAMKQVYRKYNFKAGFIDNQKNSDESLGLKTLAANSTSSNRTGTVAANPEPNAALFLSPVDIGGQTVNLDFDTGSSDLWVFSTDLPQGAIGQHTAFDATKSQTFTKTANAQWKIQYGDGSGAAGTVGTDRVTIGGVVVEKQTVELANQVSQSFVQDTNTDGLVGLAFSNLNTVNDGVQKTPQKTFFDNVMNDLDQPLFTADLAPDGTGAYEFGRIDQAKFTGDMAWIPVNASSGFWQFQSKAFMVDGQRIENPAGSDAIADTGTSLLLVDQPVADAYYQNVQGAQLNQQVGGYIYPCGAKLPDMAVAIGDSYMANIPGSQITFAAVDQANTTCFGGVQGNNGAGLQIFGDTMFKAQFVAFNGGNQSLGFAMKAGVQ